MDACSHLLSFPIYIFSQMLFRSKVPYPSWVLDFFSRGFWNQQTSQLLKVTSLLLSFSRLEHSFPRTAKKVYGFLNMPSKADKLQGS